jgi:hypothetical protein
VDGANRTAVLDSNGDLFPGAMEALGKENGVTIDKIRWLSDKKNGKTYGSMAIYVTKGVDGFTWRENRPAPTSSNRVKDHYSATSAGKPGTKHSRARRIGYAEDVRSKDISTDNAR